MDPEGSTTIFFSCVSNNTCFYPERPQCLVVAASPQGDKLPHISLQVPQLQAWLLERDLDFLQRAAAGFGHISRQEGDGA